jgi:hypothetical protein
VGDIDCVLVGQEIHKNELTHAGEGNPFRLPDGFELVRVEAFVGF